MADENDLIRTESFQYPSGHLNHLSANQEAALDKFKKHCQEKGYYEPADEQKSTVPSHDDETLLRYLRARKFVPSEAFTQFKDTEDWRKANQLEELYETIDVNEYEETRRLYPQWTGRRDKRGIPVYVFEVSHLNSKNIAAYEASTTKAPQITSKVPVKMLRLFALYENMCRFVLPLCTAVPGRPHPETPISQSNNIVDISKVGLKQFWNLKGHMQDASTLATAHYPETLDRIFIIGAPSFFPTVWGWIKRWFDPITVSKIFILSNANMKSTLEKYIDPESIPKKYGGQLDYEFGQMPVLDPVFLDNLQWDSTTSPDPRRTIPTGPIDWRENTNGAMEAIAVGSIAGKKRDERIATMNPGQRWKATDKLLDKPVASIFKTAASSSGTSTPSGVYKTSTGEHTHPPPGTEDAYTDTFEEPPEYSKASSPNPVTVAASDSNIPPSNSSSERHVPDTSRRGTYTVPASTNDKSPISPSGGSTLSPTRSENSDRVGTSESRFKQQEATHAEGTLADGTPEVRHHGYGDKTSAIEPKTVGQAPKEVPTPTLEGKEGKEEGLVAKAQAAASSVYEEVGNLVGQTERALGLGGEQEKAKETEPKQGKSEDGGDGIKEVQVEEFLRSTVRSKSQPSSAS